jgi:hypothetical protein
VSSQALVREDPPHLTLFSFPLPSSDSVFLSRLSPTSTEAQLAIIGGAYGKVKTSRFVKKVGEGKSFGFVTFDTSTSSPS